MVEWWKKKKNDAKKKIKMKEKVMVRQAKHGKESEEQIAITVDVKKKPEKKPTVTKKIYNYLEERKCACKKTAIMRDLKLSKASVNYGCGELRKTKKIGMVKYWAGGTVGKDPKWNIYWGKKL